MTGESLGQVASRRGNPRLAVERFEDLQVGAELGAQPGDEHLQRLGNAARVSGLSATITAENSKTDQSRVVFLATLCPNLSVIEEDDRHFQAVGITKVRGTDAMKTAIVALTQAISKAGEPIPIATAAKPSRPLSE